MGIEIVFSLPAERVVWSLNQITERRSKPLSIRVDSGHKYVSATLMPGAKTQGITVIYIQPSKPQQNAYVERHNRSVRHEWPKTCNDERPNMGIRGLTPAEKLKVAAEF